ncbi:MAG: dephospho-CoA kinase [Actinomycetota bacterium]
MTGRSTGRRVIGLTGGIGAGKSTVAAILAELGATIVDCDDLGRLVVEPDGRAYPALVEHFGKDILAPDGRVDRPALGGLVFDDPDALAALNAITHPAIDIEIAQAITEAQTEPIVLDMAVLVETRLGAGQYDEVLVVEAPIAARLDRLRSTRGMTDEQSRARMANQADDAQRRAVADHLIVNDGGQDDLRRTVLAWWGAEVADR